MQLLERQNNAAACIITGCYRNTNNAALLAEAGLASLAHRASELLAQAAERYVRLPEECPARRWVELMAEHALIRAVLEKSAIVGVPREQLQLHAARPPLEMDVAVDFRLQLNEPCSKDEHSDAQRRRIAEDTLRGLGAFDLEMWTDGSAEEGVRNGGAGVVFYKGRS